MLAPFFPLTTMNMQVRAFFLACLLTFVSLLLPACTGLTPHKPNPPASSNSETVFLTPPVAETAYRYSPAPLDSIQVRTDASRITEVKVKGSFPDGCMELHEVKQSHTASEILVELIARRPTEAFCTQAIRPYRFYFLLHDKLNSGTYILSLNGKKNRFMVP